MGALICFAMVVTQGCSRSTSVSTSATTEPAGPNCAQGGIAVRSGFDTDEDGQVSAAEASSTSYVCNGATGTAGTEGATGAAGVPSLNAVTPEPVGTHCSLGGYRLQTGLDVNGNARLDEAEVTSTEYLCTPEPSRTGLLLVSKTYLGLADTGCPGGYTRIAYGADANGDGTLGASEQTDSFLTCNLVPRLTSPSALSIADCTASPIVLPITAIDLDGRVTQISVQVVESGSALVFSSGPNGEVRLASGAHVSGALLAVTLTDDLGATAVVMVSLRFTGTGCQPLTTFYGVFPGSCRAVEINPIAGDDRSGPVLTARALYYNGDNGLIRTDLDLDGGTQLVAAQVDGLMGDPVQGKLLSLWSSEWNAVLPDGGAGLAITGLLDLDAGVRFAAFQSPESLDELVVLDETTFRPTAHVALPQPIPAGAPIFVVNDAVAGAVTVNQQRMIVSASDGHAVIARYGGDNTGATGVLYQVINVTTGAVVINRELYFAPGDVGGALFNWRTQEDSIQHYAMHKVGSEFFLTYLHTTQGWMDLELGAGQPQPRTPSFASQCDVENLALSADLGTAYFHAEDSCFGANHLEALYRCETLYYGNTGLAVDDRGNVNQPSPR